MRERVREGGREWGRASEGERWRGAGRLWGECEEIVGRCTHLIASQSYKYTLPAAQLTASVA